MRNLLHWAPVASGFLVLVLAMFVAVLTVAQRNNPSDLAATQSLSTRASGETVSLSLSPSSATYDYSVTGTYPVGIVLDSAGKNVDGADVVIRFDPQKAQVVGGSVATTSLFEEFPQNSVDNIRGQIKFSALTFSPKPVTGILGTFSFRPKSAGTVTFSFEFTLGSTKDSNVAESKTAKDVLDKVENGNYIFK